MGKLFDTDPKAGEANADRLADPKLSELQSLARTRSAKDEATCPAMMLFFFSPDQFFFLSFFFSLITNASVGESELDTAMATLFAAAVRNPFRRCADC